MPRAVAVVLAAGAGERLGAAEPKAFLEVGGRSLLRLATASAAACPYVDSLVIVVSAGQEGRARDEIDPTKPASIVTGGASRHESVRAGLAAVPAGAEVIVCHDAARPFASPELFSRVVGACSGPGVDGAIPIVPIPDTVKRVSADVVVGTEPRERLGLAQTPQAFTAGRLRDAHERAAAGGRTFTDDAALLEWAGFRVIAVPGEESNFKITTALDLEHAARALERERRG